MKIEEFVMFLREQLERNYARHITDDKAQCAIMAVDKGGWPRGMGIQPKLLGVNPKGTKTYSLTNDQARRAMEKLGHKPPPKGLR